MANQNAIQDDNQFPALTLHSGTAGTAETIRLTGTLDGGLSTDFKKSAFGDQVVTDLTPILQYSFEYDMVNNTEFWKTTETNSGTVTTSNAQAVVTSGTTASSVASMESVRPARYKAGIGAKLRFTAKWGTPAASCKQIIGMFDEGGTTSAFLNGYGVGYDGIDFTLFNYTNDADNSVTLANANDPLDGTGKSGVTIDQTKLNIFEIDFAYLGIGDIIYKVYSTAHKDFIEIHRIQNANISANPHSYNPNFKVWMYADNGETTNNVNMSTGSIMYATQGKVKYQELHQPQQSYRISADSITGQTQLFSIRNKSTYTSVTNFIDLLLEHVSVSYEAAAAGRGVLKLVKNPTLSGTASWTDINTTDSVVEYDTAQGTPTAEGKILAEIYVANKYDKENLADFTHDEMYISPNDEIALLAESTQSATFTAYLLWKELF